MKSHVYRAKEQDLTSRPGPGVIQNLPSGTVPATEQTVHRVDKTPHPPPISSDPPNPPVRKSVPAGSALHNYSQSVCETVAS